MIHDEQNPCPISSMLKLISAKWTVEIIRELSIKPTRTRQFLARIPGLTMKCLQERLRVLEQAGMIARVKYEEKVPRVEHHLTERGMRLMTIFLALRDLAMETTDDIGCICPMEVRMNTELPGPISHLDFNCLARRELVSKNNQ